MKNKILFSLLTLSLLLSYLKFEYSNDSYLESDFTPPEGADYRSENVNEGPWRKRISFAIATEDQSFEKSQTVITDQANVPDLLFFDDAIYVYYMAGEAGNLENVVALTTTEDEGQTWTYHHINIEDFDEPIGDPDIVLLEDGTMRMYFTAQSHEIKGHTGIHVASSTDGMNFTYLGEVFFDLTGEVSYFDSMTYQDKEGVWNMYTLKGSGESQVLIAHATSSDGLYFTEKQEVSLEAEGKICVPGDVFLGENGAVQMLATELGGKVRLFTQEGENWLAGEEILTVTEDYESREVRDPAVLRLPDGRLFMVYSTFIPE